MDNITCDSPGPANISVPLLNLPPGAYYIQWIWTETGSNWYNCFKIAIKDPSIQVRQIPIGTVDRNTILASQYNGPTYLSINVPIITMKEKFLMIKINTSKDSVSYANVTASSDTLPLVYDDGPYVTAYPGTIRSINLCNLGNNVAYVTIFPNRDYSLFEGTIEITVILYDSWLDWNGVKERVFTLDAGTTIFVWTAASSTLDVPKRVTVQGSGATAYVNGPYRSCDNSLQNAYEPNTCANVDKQQQNGQNRDQYFQVSISTDSDKKFFGKSFIEPEACPNTSHLISLLLFLLVVVLFLK